MKQQKYYGVYNTSRRMFQFGICEPTAKRASQQLFKKIGKDAYKWRFTIRKIPQQFLKKGSDGKCSLGVTYEQKTKMQ